MLMLARRHARPIAALAVIALILFMTAPHQGDYWWSEASRNALDGAFFLDLVRALPIHGPKAWAVAYYMQYPALTVGFYPPLMHLALAFAFALFGVTHAAAAAVAILFLLAYLLATYALARRLAPLWAALAAALLLAAAPEIVRWGQQVMLDIPAIALAAWAVALLVRYGITARPRDLVLSAILALAALYTKQTLAPGLLGAALGLLAWRGLPLLRRPHLWITVAITLVLLVPLAWLQLRFAQFNLVSVEHGSFVGMPSQFSAASLRFYFAHLPGMVGWPLLLLAIAGAACLVAQWPTLAPPARGTAIILFAWLAVAWIALTLIAQKEPRHGLPLVVPLPILAAYALTRLAALFRRPQPIAMAAVIASLAAFAWTLSGKPTPVITGIRQAAVEITRLMPAGGRVMLLSNRDGSFIFNVRVLDPARRLTVVRADKLFLDIAVIPALGMHPRGISAAQVAAMMNSYSIAYVVATPDLWTDAPVIRRLGEVLASPQFAPVERIPVTGDAAEHEVVVYRNLGPLAAHPEPIHSDLMGGGVQVSAK